MCGSISNSFLEDSDVAVELKAGVKLKVGISFSELWEGITDPDPDSGYTPIPADDNEQEACYGCARKAEEERRDKHNSDPERLKDGNFIRSDKLKRKG